MQISAVTSSTPTFPVEPKAATAPAPEVPAAPSDNVSLRRVAALLTMLENNPEIRPEVVARGRALASDMSYPSPDIINKLAGMVVSKS